MSILYINQCVIYLMIRTTVFTSRHVRSCRRPNGQIFRMALSLEAFAERGHEAESEGVVGEPFWEVAGRLEGRIRKDGPDEATGLMLVVCWADATGKEVGVCRVP